MKTRILVLDPIAAEGIAMLQADSDFEFEERHEFS
jgi:hypothetical protein